MSRRAMGIDEAIERYSHCIWLRSEWTEITTRPHNFDPGRVDITITLHTKSNKAHSITPLMRQWDGPDPVEMILVDGGTDQGGATILMFTAAFGDGLADFAVVAGSLHKGYDALGLPASRKWSPALPGPQ